MLPLVWVTLFMVLVPGNEPELWAEEISFPDIGIQISEDGSGHSKVANAIKIFLGLTVLSLAPAILIAMTSFTRIVIVLSMLRHAFGMQQTPPNTVIVSLALFLTTFNMMPSIQQIHESAVKPYLDGQIESKSALTEGFAPLKDFMVRQTREEDLMLMVEISKSERPKKIDDISAFNLIPAFMLSELKSAFQIGFVVFLPFLLIDFVVASVLMSMGMLMVPPMMISLPIKVLMFVLIDGWNLVVYSLLNSFS
ncbi:MAG: flagellar type III secretion system pore protein FliP [Desulfobacteraceae bacterium]